MAVTTANSDGTYTLSIASQVDGTYQVQAIVTDLAGNPTTTIAGGTDRQVLVDLTTPVITLQQGFTQSDPTSGSTIVFRLISTEPLNLTTVTSGDFTLTNATFGSFDTTDPASIRILVTASAQGAVTIAPSAAFAVADLVGNVATAAATQALVDLGAVAQLASMPSQYFVDWIKERFTRGRANDQEIIDGNVKALQVGIDAANASGQRSNRLSASPR